LNISFFEDDADQTQLETLITQINPKELILEKGKVSKKLAKLLRNNLDNPQYNYLDESIEFWSSENTRDELKNYYFENIPEKGN
jgi:DNA mismatch repair protein MSH6